MGRVKFGMVYIALQVPYFMPNVTISGEEGDYKSPRIENLFLKIAFILFFVCTACMGESILIKLKFDTEACINLRVGCCHVMLMTIG